MLDCYSGGVIKGVSLLDLDGKLAEAGHKALSEFIKVCKSLEGSDKEQYMKVLNGISIPQYYGVRNAVRHILCEIENANGEGLCTS